MQKTVAKINLKSIEQNAKLFKKTSGVKLCAVVKANAYGHGAQEVVNVLNTVADAFAVALIEEGISIREAAAGKDILVFTPPLTREQAESIIDNGFIASVGDLQTANLLKKTAREKGAVCRVHIKVNLGMNRYGVSGAALGKVCKILCATKWIKVEGMYGHLHEQTRAAAEDCRNRFLACKAVYERYFENGLFHLAATYGVGLGKEFSFGMVRVGLGLYGYLPTNGAEEKTERLRKKLKKAMRVYAPVVQVRKCGFGGAGYGSVTIEKGETLSVLRYGYADGFLRKKENGTVGAEKNANVLCMDVCIKRTESKKGRWQTVLCNAEKTAEQTGTATYEVLCAATRRAEFIYEYE